MAVIDTYPVTLRRRETRIAPAIDRGRPVEPQRRLTVPEITLSAKQRMMLEWLQANEGCALLSQMPQKAGLLSLYSLMQRGLLKITVEFAPHGKTVMSQLAAKEVALERRAAIDNRMARKPPGTPKGFVRASSTDKTSTKSGFSERKVLDLTPLVDHKNRGT